MEKLLRKFIAFALFVIVVSFEDNYLLGDPEIRCNQDSIEMYFRTAKSFRGKVFVKGSYEHPECRVDYSKVNEDRLMGDIRINHGACNMDRQRMISPEGMMFSTVLIVSFHPLFLTKVDKAYNVKCMYRDIAKTVQAELDVSMLPTESVQSDMPMPTCSYTIRKDQLDGEVLKYARVGDQVVHRWQCDTTDYGLLIHSCFVEDGQGEKQMIIDEKGCHTDRLLLGDPTYVEALNIAYRESYVFKFADRVAIRFQCEIRLCIKEDGGCDGITPPICLESNSIHDDLIINETRRIRRGTSVKDADLFSQTLFVIDSSGDDEKADLQNNDGKICFNDNQILALIFLATLPLIAFNVAVFIFCCMQRRTENILFKSFG